MTQLTYMDGGGDTRLVWDPNDPVDVEQARVTVEKLRASGFVFYRIDGKPADSPDDALAVLEVKPVQASELLAPVAPAEASGSAPAPCIKPHEAPVRRRVRQSKPPIPVGPEYVAHRQMQGG